MVSEAERFVRGNGRLERALRDPGARQRVGRLRDDMAQADREQATQLAVIRRAADLTQEALAEEMGIPGAAANGFEAQEELLLSILAKHLRAAGASDARIVVTMGDREVEYPLPQPWSQE